jgi:hypothetical protein
MEMARRYLMPVGDFGRRPEGALAWVRRTYMTDYTTCTADHYRPTMANGPHRSSWVSSFENGIEEDDILTMGMESAAPVDTDLIFDAYDNDDFWLPPTLQKPHTRRRTGNRLPGPGPDPFMAGCSMHGMGGSIQGTQCGSSFWSSFASQVFTHFRNSYGAL